MLNAPHLFIGVVSGVHVWYEDSFATKIINLKQQQQKYALKVINVEWYVNCKVIGDDC